MSPSAAPARTPRDGAIEVTATFSETVRVDSGGVAPRIPIIIGSTTRQAIYTGGSGTENLVFRYTVVAGDSDDDGVEVEG